jgi:hypothetical protein
MDVVLLGLGGILAIIGYVWLLIAAFSESIGWGIGSLLCGIVALIYGVMKWDELKVPVILYVAGGVLYGIGRVI